MIQQNLKEGYASDKETKKILDDELNKRNKVHKQKKQKQNKTLLMIMITLISIYVAIYTASRFTTNNPRVSPAKKNKQPTATCDIHQQTTSRSKQKYNITKTRNKKPTTPKLKRTQQPV